MERRFARFRRGPFDPQPGVSEVPEDGMCLSVFVVIEAPDDAGSILLGRIEPGAPWLELGGLDPRRLERISDQWMLPSCHLLLFESPQEAARRVLNEQLGSPSLELRGPSVFSEAYPRPGAERNDPHWDLQFVYRGRWGSPSPPQAAAWRQLEFVKVARTPRSAIARGHGDVLELAGLRPRDEPAGPA